MKRTLSARVKIIAVSTGLLLAVLPLLAKTAPKKVIEETVTIENSGSTNTSGYEITVSTRGRASYHETRAERHICTLSKEVTAKLFADVAAAMPLTALPVRHGMRSASFGTQTFVIYRGQRSPDLTIPSGPEAMSLHDDILAIEKVFAAGNHFRRPVNCPAQH